MNDAFGQQLARYRETDRGIPDLAVANSWGDCESATAGWLARRSGSARGKTAPPARC